MTTYERNLLEAIAQGLKSRLLNAGGTGSKFHADKIQQALDGADYGETYRPEKKPEKVEPWNHLTWDDCAIEFEQSFQPEGYNVKVADNSGDVVKTYVHLHEWSGHVTPFINNKDIPGLVRYLAGLNKTERRDGFVIRSEEWL